MIIQEIGFGVGLWEVAFFLSVMREKESEAEPGGRERTCEAKKKDQNRNPFVAITCFNIHVKINLTTE